MVQALVAPVEITGARCESAARVPQTAATRENAVASIYPRLRASVIRELRHHADASLVKRLEGVCKRVFFRREACSAFGDSHLDIVIADTLAEVAGYLAKPEILALPLADRDEKLARIATGIAKNRIADLFRERKWQRTVAKGVRDIHVSGNSQTPVSVDCGSDGPNDGERGRLHVPSPIPHARPKRKRLGYREHAGRIEDALIDSIDHGRGPQALPGWEVEDFWSVVRGECAILFRERFGCHWSERLEAELTTPHDRDPGDVGRLGRRPSKRTNLVKLVMLYRVIPSLVRGEEGWVELPAIGEFAWISLLCRNRPVLELSTLTTPDGAIDAEAEAMKKAYEQAATRPIDLGFALITMNRPEQRAEFTYKIDAPPN
jgi:hypothetical protein